MLQFEKKDFDYVKAFLSLNHADRGVFDISLDQIVSDYNQNGIIDLKKYGCEIVLKKVDSDTIRVSIKTPHFTTPIFRRDLQYSEAVESGIEYHFGFAVKYDFENKEVIILDNPCFTSPTIQE